MIIIPDTMRRPAEVERDELKKQLAEARAEIERLKQELRDNSTLAARQIVPAEMLVDDLTAEIERLNKNMRFANAINLAMQEAGQDLPDLRGHECLAKHKLLSLFDFWRKKVRPRLPGFIDDEISSRDKLIEQLKLALKTLRKYPHTYKMTGQSCIVVDKDLEQCDAALLAAEKGE